MEDVCRVEEILCFFVDSFAGCENGWVDGLRFVRSFARVSEEVFVAGGVGAEEFVVDLVAQFGGEPEED